MSAILLQDIDGTISFAAARTASPQMSQNAQFARSLAAF